MESPGHAAAEAAAALLATPLAVALTAGLRRLSRERPEAFERIAPYERARFAIAPDELPIAFLLVLDPRAPGVRIVPAAARPSCAARISGGLGKLLRLVEGGLDADAVFFARGVTVEGDIAAVMVLHNALEAADLDLPALAGRAAAPVRRLRALAARFTARRR